MIDNIQANTSNINILIALISNDEEAVAVINLVNDSESVTNEYVINYINDND